MWTHYTLLRNARSKQRSAHLRLATQVRAQILPHAEGALRRFSETARSKSRSRAPPAASGGVRHVAGGWGKAPQPPARSVGSFLGVKAKPLRGRCASLDPHPLRQRPSKPLRGPLARFQAEGGSRGWCGPQPRRGEDTALTRPERPKPAGRVSGALFPRHPCPSARRPRQGRRKALIRRAVQGAPPAWGSRGAQPLGPAQRTKNPSAEGEHFLLFELRFWLFKRPQKGPDLQIQRGEAKARSGAGLRGLIVVSPDNKVVSPDNSGVMGNDAEQEAGSDRQGHRRNLGRWVYRLRRAEA